MCLLALFFAFVDVTENPRRFLTEVEHILSCANNWEISLANIRKSHRSFFGAAVHETPDIQQFIDKFGNGDLEVSSV